MGIKLAKSKTAAKTAEPVEISTPAVDPLDDETDGHVDGITTFARPGTIIIESTDHDDDPRKPFFDSVREQLEQETDAKGRSFELLTLPEASVTGLDALAPLHQGLLATLARASSHPLARPLAGDADHRRRDLLFQTDEMGRAF